MRDITLAEANSSHMSRAQLEADGWRESDIRRGLSGGGLRRLQPNRYVLAAVWDDLWPESQHRVEVSAAAAEMRGGASVVSHVSAAVVHGWPLYRLRPSKVEATALGGWRTSNNSHIRRHEDALAEDDVTVVDGVVCTTVERTIFDVARTVGWEQAVVCADAALRSIAVRQRVYDLTAAEQWRDRLSERMARSPGVRGIRQVRSLVGFADGRAELPGESISRVQLARLGFTDIELQVPVASPRGGHYEVDIALRQARTFWEFDGKGKYLDEAKRAGKTVEQVLLDEKRREDWIRGTTQWRLCRGEDAHIATPAALAHRLASFGVLPPG